MFCGQYCMFAFIYCTSCFVDYMIAFIHRTVCYVDNTFAVICCTFVLWTISLRSNTAHYVCGRYMFSVIQCTHYVLWTICLRSYTAHNVLYDMFVVIHCTLCFVADMYVIIHDILVYVCGHTLLIMFYGRSVRCHIPSVLRVIC
jgi:hypothetical protein